MCSIFMLLHTTRTVKTLSANRTIERCLTCMSSGVYSKICFQSKSFSTQCTRIRSKKSSLTIKLFFFFWDNNLPFSTMSSLMNFKMRLLRKRFVTYGALKRFVPRMYQIMCKQRSRMCKRFLAYLTNIRLFSSVNLQWQHSLSKSINYCKTTL